MCANPLSGCCVRTSYRRNFDSKVVATRVFISLSRLGRREERVRVYSKIMLGVASGLIRSR